MTTHFILVLAGFALLMVGGFMLDRLAARSGWRLAGPQRRETAEEKVLRAGIGAFFATAIGVLFAAYYGLQHAEYRSGAIAWQATLVAPAETR